MVDSRVVPKVITIVMSPVVDKVDQKTDLQIKRVILHKTTAFLNSFIDGSKVVQVVDINNTVLRSIRIRSYIYLFICSFTEQTVKFNCHLTVI